MNFPNVDCPASRFCQASLCPRSNAEVLQKALENAWRRTGWQMVRVGVGTLRPTGRSDLRGRRSQAIADTADQRLPFGGPGSACRPMIAASSGGGGISADPPAECPVRHSMRPRPARSVPAPFQDDLDAASLIFPVPSGDCPGYPSSWSPVRPKYAGWLCSPRSFVRGSDLKPWRSDTRADERGREPEFVSARCSPFDARCWPRQSQPACWHCAVKVWETCRKLLATQWG